MSKTFNQYFSRYAESEVDVLTQYESLLPDEFLVDNVLVVPAYQETSAFIERFLVSTLSKSPVLLVVVINEPIVEPITQLLNETSSETIVDQSESIFSQSDNRQQALFDY